MNRKPETLEEATDLARRLLTKSVAFAPDVLRMLHDQDNRLEHERRFNAELLALASEDPFAWEALVLRIVQSVDESGQIPRDLRSFHRRVLWGDWPRPSARQGAPASYPVHRAVILSVLVLNRMGVRQKDPDPTRLSAIRAVAIAMNGLGVAPKTYSAVEDLWKRSKPLRERLNASTITIPDLEIELSPRTR